MYTVIGPIALQQAALINFMFGLVAVFSFPLNYFFCEPLQQAQPKMLTGICPTKYDPQNIGFQKMVCKMISLSLRTYSFISIT